jgi:hypothetical protein
MAKLPDLLILPGRAPSASRVAEAQHGALANRGGVQMPLRFYRRPPATLVDMIVVGGIIVVVIIIALVIFW